MRIEKKRGGISILMNYLSEGISYLVISIPIAFILLSVYYGIKFLVKRELKITISRTICEFAWLIIVILILKITGIFGGNYGVTSPFDGSSWFSFNIFEQGITTATILNLILFIPYGFLSAIIFKKIRKRCIYGILIGLIFACSIEFLQSFTGRFVELEDILMNTGGTYIGYIISIGLIKYK